MEKSILYAKIAVPPPQKKNFPKSQLYILYRPFIFIVAIMSQIPNNV